MIECAIFNFIRFKWNLIWGFNFSHTPAFLLKGVHALLEIINSQWKNSFSLFSFLIDLLLIWLTQTDVVLSFHEIIYKASICKYDDDQRTMNGNKIYMITTLEELWKRKTVTDVQGNQDDECCRIICIRLRISGRGKVIMPIIATDAESDKDKITASMSGIAHTLSPVLQNNRDGSR